MSKLTNADMLGQSIERQWGSDSGQSRVYADLRHSHEALVGALEAVVKGRERVDPEGLFDGLEIIQARAALAAARGES
jgi:hypothetical protein